ncbi:hypothetical protein G8O24_16645 [Bradyrhizobium sp. INPA01-394B]|uniref:Uncharacterized protein n=1 Tax=Bradyrhizobium campsiandrae TaxID=1729892 RepID=A0ABR7U799_9BRAD|nr:hypothetical protein [Bradyrhizobium campsiandrae]MBC9878970.1 hypothetical protein [Bradyrhizobium campsiandrae]MBC9979683.1 hypothetical protein [Bradyrhizobium campsiandrae]
MHASLERKWLEARERMRRRVDAVFWQELAVSLPERDRYVAWILDHIVKQEYLAALGDEWTVWREDKDGKYVPVERNLSYVEAQSLLKELNGGGTNVHYWYGPQVETSSARTTL